MVRQNWSCYGIRLSVNFTLLLIVFLLMLKLDCHNDLNTVSRRTIGRKKDRKWYLWL